MAAIPPEIAASSPGRRAARGEETHENRQAAVAPAGSRGAFPSRARMANDIAQRRLGSAMHTALRGISCSVENGLATLRGRVPTFYCKQLAQSLLVGIAGIERIDNQIEVIVPVMPGSGTSKPG
jgi:osmotically-inducible protein OsmY